MTWSFLRPKADAATNKAKPVAEGASVQAERARARRRLVGALVLLALGVVTFPLLFETQPRPIGVDTPISVVQRGATAPLAASTASTEPVKPSLPILPVDAEAAPGAVGEAASSARTAVAVAAPPPVINGAPNSAVAALPKPDARAANAKPITTAASAPASKPANPLPTQERPAGDKPAVATARAEPTASRASEVALSSVRYVVQVGAFVDDRPIRETRQKVERLGLKTYTQVIENDAGKRTRVRVGPFDTRAEADAAAKKLKAAGLPADLLKL